MTPWTAACQAPLSMGFSRQEYWSGLPFPSPGDLPDPGMEPRPPTLQADSLPSEPPGSSQEKYNRTKEGVWQRGVSRDDMMYFRQRVSGSPLSRDNTGVEIDVMRDCIPQISGREMDQRVFIKAQAH